MVAVTMAGIDLSVVIPEVDSGVAAVTEDGVKRFVRKPDFGAEYSGR